MYAAEPNVSYDPAKDSLVYVGTYTGPNKGKGIYAFKLQTENLAVSQNITLAPMGLVAQTQSPSYLAIDPKRRLLFAVNEVSKFQGKDTGAVSAFKIDPQTGKLTLINQQPSMGTGPCHLVLDPQGKNLLVANYNSGSAAVIPVAADGTLGEASAVVQHTGSSVNADRQKGPHAHCVTLDPANQFAFVCDLGIDKVMIYRFDAEHGTLTPNDPPSVSLKAGAGPRHLVFRPDGKFAFVINELNSTITTFSYDPTTGALTEVQTVSSLPPDFHGPNTCAEIATMPDGKFLFASNRGNDSLALFSINADKGTLDFVEAQTTGGKTPRHFGIHPSGQHLVIANQNSDTLLVARIDSGSGRLKPSGVFVPCPSPVCAIFLPPAGAEK